MSEDEDSSAGSSSSGSSLVPSVRSASLVASMPGSPVPQPAGAATPPHSNAVQVDLAAFALDHQYARLSPPPQVPERGRRKAALEAKKRIREWTTMIGEEDEDEGPSTKKVSVHVILPFNKFNAAYLWQKLQIS